MSLILINCFNSLALAKSGSESSISEACDSVKESTKRFEEEKDECSDNEQEAVKVSESNKFKTLDNKISISSAKSMTQLKETEELSGNGNDIVKRRDRDVVRRREQKLRSVSHIEQSVDDCSGSNDVFDEAGSSNEKGIRPSKSDTSLTESFVMIDSENGGGNGNNINGGGKRRLSNKQNVLRDGEKV